MPELMTHDDVPAVADIHYETWNDYDMSTQLGKGYLRWCYKALLDPKYAFGLVQRNLNQIVAYAIGFVDYPRFYRDYRYRILAQLLLYGKFGAALRSFKGEWKTAYVRDGRYHLGCFGLNHMFRTGYGKRAIRECVDEVIDRLVSEYGSCWGVTDERNIAVDKILTRRYDTRTPVQLKHRTLIFFERWR